MTFIVSRGVVVLTVPASSPVSTVDEVLARALTKPLVPVEWPNDLEAVAKKPDGEAIFAH